MSAPTANSLRRETIHQAGSGTSKRSVLVMRDSMSGSIPQLGWLAPKDVVRAVGVHLGELASLNHLADPLPPGPAEGEAGRLLPEFGEDDKRVEPDVRRSRLGPVTLTAEAGCIHGVHGVSDRTQRQALALDDALLSARRSGEEVRPRELLARGQFLE